MDEIAEGQEMLSRFFAELETPQYAKLYETRLQWLRELFKNFRDADPAAQAWLKQLLEQHATMCHSAAERRRHNAVVLLFVAGHTGRDVARMLRVTESMLWRDVKQVFAEIMLLVFGVEGLKPRAGRWAALDGSNEELEDSTHQPHSGD